MENVWLKREVLLLLLFYVFSFFYRTDYSFDQDLGRHLKLGEIISQTASVPKVNLFSYTYPQFPFVNHHYLFEVGSYLLSNAIGINGLLWIKVILVLISLTLILFTVKKENYLLALPVSFIFLHVLRDRTDLRPEILSFLFTALTYFILEKFDKGKSRLIFLLPLIQLLWVNTHIYFPVGIMLQGIFWLQQLFVKDYVKLRTLTLILITSALATLFNPNFLTGALYPLTVFQNYGYTIAENQNIFLLESINFHDPNFLFVKVITLITIAMIFWSVIKKLQLKYILLSLLGVALALTNIRSFPYLIFISLPAVLNLARPFNRKFIKAAAAITAILLIIESSFYLSGTYYQLTDSDITPGLTTESHVKGAMDFLLAKHLPQPIFNNFDIGSFIIYRGFPNYKVFVDGRPESYPASFFQQTYIPMQENYQFFQQMAQKYNFQTIIFSHTDQTPWAKNFLANVVNDKQWQIVYFDDFMLILVKANAATQINLPKIDLSTLTPAAYHYTNHTSYLRMAVFLLNTNNIASAERFTQKALSIDDNSPLGNLIMANLSANQSIFLTQKYSQKIQSSVWW